VTPIFIMLVKGSGTYAESLVFVIVCRRNTRALT
jgi:hypothetical protein